MESLPNLPNRSVFIYPSRFILRPECGHFYILSAFNKTFLVILSDSDERPRAARRSR